MKLSVIIPAYNESEGVASTSQSLRSVLPYLKMKYDIEIIFVNDGSKDDTGRLLTETFADLPEVKVVSHEVNKGLGAAIRTGFAHCTGDVVITTDFDGTYSFKTIPLLLERMNVENVDIVTASPYHPRGAVEGVPRYRLMFSFGASLLYRLLVRWDVYTWTALFRAYRRPVIETISFDNNGFLAGTELLVKAISAGYKVSEYPTTLHVRQFGQSSIKLMRVTKAHLRYQLRILKKELGGHARH